ncbi:hypothetical protein CNMCM6069_003015 [Aspergillus lentulus]|nr:hypothetical protein CNMCM6069_003015 [Aspergillus lentulus]
MKSPLYIITALLPLIAELAAASPTMKLNVRSVDKREDSNDPGESGIELGIEPGIIPRNAGFGGFEQGISGRTSPPGSGGQGGSGQGGSGQGGSGHGSNNCRVSKPYNYYKFPCESSFRTGRAAPGSTFTSTCKYR